MKLLKDLAEPETFPIDELREKVQSIITLTQAMVDDLERGLDRLQDVDRVQVLY